MHGFNRIPVKELTSSAAIYGIAAELIQENMKSEKNEEYRVGCCWAFGEIEDAARVAFYTDRLSMAAMHEMQSNVRRARASFAGMYKQDGGRATKNDVYWMGTRSDRGQKRRITALLLAASVVKD